MSATLTGETKKYYTIHNNRLTYRRCFIPYESKKQQRYLHAHPDILGKEGLKEWDTATNFKKLPEKKKKVKKSYEVVLTNGKMSVGINKSYLSNILKENEEIQYALSCLFKDKIGNVTDSDIIEFATEHKLTIEMVREAVYGMLKDFFACGVSNYPHNKDIVYEYEALQKGTQVEYEHTNSKIISTKIAKDHLAEFPDYYTELEKMENKLKAKEGSSEE